MNRVVVFEKIISIAIIVLVIYLNIISTNEVYVGDFYRNRFIQYPPPFRTQTILYIYDIVGDNLEVVEVSGFLINLNRELSENKIVSVKARGLDIYVLILSITILITYFKLIKPLVSRIPAYLINISLLLVLITSIYIYVYLLNMPVVHGSIVELVETIECKTIGLLNVCIVDSFTTDTIIYLKTGNDILVELIKNEVVIDRVLVKSSEDYCKVVETSSEVKLLVYSTYRYISITYRRISFIDTRDYLSTVIVTYVPLTIAIATIVTNRVIYSRTGETVKNVYKTPH